MFQEIHSSAALSPVTDLLIPLGKNIGVGFSPQNMRDNHLHLSVDSKIILLAAAQLARPDLNVLLSGGPTAGKDFPPEPEAAQDYLGHRFPRLSQRGWLLDMNSIDTAANAENSARILRDKHYQHIGLISVGYHVKNAATLFENYGVPVESVIFAEDIVAERSKHHATYVTAWKAQDRIQTEIHKETLRTLLLHTIDRRGKGLRVATWLSRSLFNK